MQVVQDRDHFGVGVEPLYCLVTDVNIAQEREDDEHGGHVPVALADDVLDEQRQHPLLDGEQGLRPSGLPRGERD